MRPWLDMYAHVLIEDNSLINTCSFEVLGQIQEFRKGAGGGGVQMILMEH